MASVETPSARAPTQEPIRGALAGGVARRARGDGTSAFWLALAINVAIVLLAGHFPYQDGANHLARYVLLERAWSGSGSPDVLVRVVPTPYIALDAVGAALVHVVGPQFTLRVMTLLAVGLTPIGMYLLLGQTAPHRRGWALAGVLLGLSWYVLDGLLNFAIGAGLVFVWLAAWWPRRDGASAAARLGLAAAGVGLFLVHLSAALCVLTVVWIDGALALLRARSVAGAARASIRPRALTTAAVTTAVFGVWAAVEWTLGPPHAAEVAPAYRDAGTKLMALGAPFYVFDLGRAMLFACLWAASLGAFLYVNRGTLRRDALGRDAILVSAAAFLVLFAVSPASVGSAGGVDVRWLLFAYLLPFCAPGAGTPRRQWPGLAVAFLAALMQSGLVYREARRRDRLLADFDDVLARVPHGTRLLPIIADSGVSRVGTYDEYAFWHVVRNAGRVPGLFNYNGTRPTDAPFTHFAHFQVRARPYVPPFQWGVRTFAPLDWASIRRDYDYIVQAGADPRAASYLGAHALAQHRAGAITLYRVRP